MSIYTANKHEQCVELTELVHLICGAQQTQRAQNETLHHRVDSERQRLFAMVAGTMGLHTEGKMDLLAAREKEAQELLWGTLKDQGVISRVCIV